MWKNSWTLILLMVGLSLVPHGAIRAQRIPGQTFSDLRWRFVGPFRGGWATTAVGVPDAPNTFYFGAVGGGVWKTMDAGRTWQGFMQHEGSSSVGAMAVAPSNSNVLYVGTGQADLRYDILDGNGVYRSDDAGKTWEHVGLAATSHIGSVLVDPHDAQRVLVAALGHVFVADSNRGVYLSIDGGKNWRRVLYLDDKTGAIDLASDPMYPSVVYASLWQMRMHPWLDYFEPQAGPGSGIYRSEDRGEHWKQLTGGGLPAGPLGRIGLAVPRGSGGRIVYASIAVAASGSGLYRSNDGGQHWDFVNDNGALASSYFGHVTVDPNNPDVVYVMGRSISRSNDGGKHFTLVKGAPGGDDYHYLWINPSDPTHMITASDQGTVVSLDGGSTWSSWMNQPTGQFYRLATNDRFPYRIYSGQQDIGTVGILSRGPYGVIEERDWHPVGGDERDFVVPKPGNPDLIFASGLGGRVSRFDDVTRQVAEVSPWPVPTYAAHPMSVRYRYSWLTPLVFSPRAPHPLYFGAQVLFRSVDDGNHWETISPDLTGKGTGEKDCEHPDLVQARDCGFGVILSIAPSPVADGVIWVGTDDGLVQLTTDGGKHWRNITPPTVPLWGRVDAIDTSPFSKHAAYVAVNTQRLGDSKPLILKTSDDGRSWMTITTGLPAGEYVNVVRADPVKSGLLYAGTSRSVYVSFDDGGQWQPLSLNLPTMCVGDLLEHDGDIIVASQGRGIWILDNIEMLRQLAPGAAAESVHLFRPAQAWRLRGNENRDTPPPVATPLGQNPPGGAMIDYWLKDNSSGPVTLTIRDSEGHIVRRFSSDEKPDSLPADRYFEEAWLGKAPQLSGTSGMHRFVWDLRSARPAALRYGYSIAAVWGEGTPIEPEGPLVLPGSYTVTLSAGGKDYTQPLVVKLDPRVHISKGALREQLAFAQRIYDAVEKGLSAYKAIARTIKDRKESLPAATVDSLSTIADKGKTSISSVIGVLTGLAGAVQSADAVPTQGQRDVFSDYQAQLDTLLGRLRRIQY